MLIAGINNSAFILVISPLLSNIYLHVLDKIINNPKGFYRHFDIKMVRYADDFLLGLAGPRDEAVEIKNKIAEFLCNDLKLDLNQEKTLITNAHHQKAKFLGYEVHVIHEDSKHDQRGQRSINGVIGLCIPMKVKMVLNCVPIRKQPMQRRQLS